MTTFGKLLKLKMQYYSQIEKQERLNYDVEVLTIRLDSGKLGPDDLLYTTKLLESKRRELVRCEELIESIVSVHGKLLAKY